MEYLGKSTQKNTFLEKFSQCSHFITVNSNYDWYYYKYFSKLQKLFNEYKQLYIIQTNSKTIK